MNEYVMSKYASKDDMIAAMQAEIDELRARSLEDAENTLRLIGTIKYLVGIAERGTGSTLPLEGVTIEQFVLAYVKKLEEENTRLKELLGQALTFAREHEAERDEGMNGTFRMCCVTRPDEDHAKYCNCNQLITAIESQLPKDKP